MEINLIVSISKIPVTTNQIKALAKAMQYSIYTLHNGISAHVRSLSSHD